MAYEYQHAKDGTLLVVVPCKRCNEPMRFEVDKVRYQIYAYGLSNEPVTTNCDRCGMRIIWSIDDLNGMIEETEW